MRIGSVVVYVKDQKRALRFYQDVFGFQVTLNRPIGDSEERWIEMKLSDDSVRLVLSSAKGARHFGQSVGGWTNIIFSVEEANFEERVQEMGQAGADVIEGPESLEWGKWAIVADRDGNLFGLSSPKSEDA